MKITCIMVLTIVLILSRTTHCTAASEFIGIVKTVSQDAFLIRKGETIAASVNMKMMVGDVVRTGPNGAIGFILKDDTIISMGSGSEVVIDDFLFDPVEKKLSLIARMFHGTAAYLSGQIVKLSPESVRFETPAATIGMRGTHFLVKTGEE